MSDEDDDIPRLSSEALQALNEFYAQQKEKEEKLKSLKDNKDHFKLNFEENWQLSQFWYDDKTAEILSKEAIRCGKRIALISCPTLYKSIKLISFESEVTIFEFDERFSVYGSDFIFYDYKSPLDIPRELSGSFDIVIADPPFLSEECLTKVAITTKFLTKERIILCTGAAMEDLAERLLNVKKSKFEPKHKNNLANEFYCYTNYEIAQYI